MLLAKIRREFGVKFTLRRILYIEVLKFINLTKKKKKVYQLYTNYRGVDCEFSLSKKGLSKS